MVRPSALQRGGDKNASQTPYKHRLAHTSGRRSPFRAGVPVRGVLGRSPNDFCVLFFTEKDGPAGKRANYAFAKGFAPPLGDCKPGPTTGGN